MPINSLKVIERAAAGRFFQPGYVARNIDIRRIYERFPQLDIEKHFNTYGIAEGRTQFTREFFERLVEFNAKKLTLFQDVFAVDPRELANKRLPFSFARTPLKLEDYDGESSGGAFGPFVEDVKANPEKLFMDFGCGLRDEIFVNCLYLEVYPSRTADVIVTPNERLPFKNNSFDGIVSAAVLEHVRRPWEVVREFHRVLKPGGKAYIDWPFLQPFHGYPSHYYNATPSGLSAMFEDNGFELVSKMRHPLQEADSTLLWILRWMRDGIENPELQTRFESLTVKDILALKANDGLMKLLVENMNPKMKENLSCGNCLIAAKKAWF